MTPISPDELRARFARALSAMYRDEVPAYATLLSLVARVNERAGEHAEARVAVERHGAIRLGRPDELASVARLFGVFGMDPVGYYDLAAAGIPVHSTAFRPVSASSLARDPFRMFVSLLRPELITDATLRTETTSILARRRIFSPELDAAIERAEREGVAPVDADRFVALAVAPFRWQAAATVDHATYQRLRVLHPLIADVACFAGPHVNHLTPRTLDIDAVQSGMSDAGLRPKPSIEGPPARRVPILLRQTSFQALQEAIRFPSDDGADAAGAHTARFGEVESRGAALTPTGRALYDQLLAKNTLAAFPDDWDAMRAAGLVYAVARPVDGGIAHVPVTYEDFLPVSAAGIFRSNLGTERALGDGEPGQQSVLEAAIGRSLADPFALYAAQVRAERGFDAVPAGAGATAGAI